MQLDSPSTGDLAGKEKGLSVKYYQLYLMFLRLQSNQTARAQPFVSIKDLCSIIFEEGRGFQKVFLIKNAYYFNICSNRTNLTYKEGTQKLGETAMTLS